MGVKEDVLAQVMGKGRPAKAPNDSPAQYDTLGTIAAEGSVDYGNDELINQMLGLLQSGDPKVVEEFIRTMLIPGNRNGGFPAEEAIALLSQGQPPADKGMDKNMGAIPEEILRLLTGDAMAE